MSSGESAGAFYDRDGCAPFLSSLALAGHFFEDEVEGAAGLGGELLAHDFNGAEGAGFLAFFDEGADEGEADFFYEIAAACFTDGAELGVEDEGGLVDAFGGEGLADAGGGGFAAEIGALAEVLRQDALLSGCGLGGISALAEQGGDGGTSPPSRFAAPAGQGRW